MREEEDGGLSGVSARRHAERRRNQERVKGLEDFYARDVQQTLQALRTGTEGLQEQEAAERLAADGPNKLAEGKKPSLFLRFLKQLSDPMILILLAAAGLSAITAAYSANRRRTCLSSWLWF